MSLTLHIMRKTDPLSPPERLMLLLMSASLAGFAWFGSGIPGMTGTAHMGWMGTSAAALIILDLWRTVWNYPRLAAVLAVYVVGSLITRGTLAWILGGPERTGVFFLYAFAAVAVVNSLAKEQA